MALWLCSHVAMWLHGYVAVWQCCYVAKWSPSPSTYQLKKLCNIWGPRHVMQGDIWSPCRMTCASPFRNSSMNAESGAEQKSGLCESCWQQRVIAAVADANEALASQPQPKTRNLLADLEKTGLAFKGVCQSISNDNSLNIY